MDYIMLNTCRILQYTRLSNNNDTLQNHGKASLRIRQYHMGSTLSSGYQGIGVNPTESDKLVFSLKEMDYEERLRELKIPSLVYRRRRGDMIQMYKIINGLVRLNINALFTPAKVRSTREFLYTTCDQ